ncbi:helix-turn-helix domain-containing protein [Actinomadura yumaensis]|uniref:helix-turn-helix domain-containing protein n=1 Tax=Actinomadura TaxID=1988 RepID=UPI00132C185B|nr:helix-turn-helix domain-containing protein [Actinomadura sp. J1-007]MWK34814.1 PucR family transcriptional regulator [Actinomadura sp. J1-007]
MTHAELDVRPFEAIPRELVRRMRPLAGPAADQLLADLAGRGTDERAAAEMRAGIVEGLEHFYDLVENPGTAWERIAAAHRELGRAMAVKGRDPEETHRALHRSARATWRTLTALAESLEVDRRTLGRIAEAQFGYLDAVAAQVAEGYETEAAGSEEALGRRRRRLLNLLFDGGAAAERTVPGDGFSDASSPSSPSGASGAADADEIADAAASARWRIPRTVAAVALHPREGAAARPPALPPDVLADLGRSEPRLLLPDPDGPGRARLLDALLRDWIVAAGPTVAPAEAADSLRWARRALALARRGRLPAGSVVRCMDHVPTLVIFMAEDLIAHAADSRLAPLRGLSPVQAERLSETLLSLLENNFNATEAGNRLHVHPQTVRYRLRHLEELFGSDLQDPRRCLELEMILHARSRSDRRTGAAAARSPVRPADPSSDRPAEPAPPPTPARGPAT